MDSGFNMLGQFQGDSSLGLGSFQGNSHPSFASANPEGLVVQQTGWYRHWDHYDEQDKWDREELIRSMILTDMDMGKIWPDKYKEKWSAETLDHMFKTRTAWVPTTVRLENRNYL